MRCFPLSPNKQPQKLHLLPALVLCLFLAALSGCSASQTSSISPVESIPPVSLVSSETPVEEPEGIKLLGMVLEADDSYFLMEPLDGKGRLAVSYTDKTLFLDENQQRISHNELKPGLAVEITYNGLVKETYPGQTSCTAVKLASAENADMTMLDAYLAAVEHFYQEDDGLNNDIRMLVMDTTSISDMNVGEKALFLTTLENKYKLEVSDQTYEQLKEGGHLGENGMYFEDGILFRFKEPIYDSNSKTLVCGISKWRSGDGAIGADKVTVSNDGTQWNIDLDEMWIS